MDSWLGDIIKAVLAFTYRNTRAERQTDCQE